MYQRVKAGIAKAKQLTQQADFNTINSSNYSYHQYGYA